MTELQNTGAKRTVVIIKTNAELEQFRSKSEGFIYNDFSGKAHGGKDYNILHIASCYWLDRSNINVPKYFFSNFDEAIEWLQENRGKEGLNWRRCGTCKPEVNLIVKREPSTQTFKAEIQQNLEVLKVPDVRPSVSCFKLKERTAEQIASFLIKGFNEEKILFDVNDFKDKGFTKESLINDKNNLFRFLILVAYDRRPFWPWEIVWNKDSQSVHTLLDRNNLFDLDKINALNEKQLENILKECKVKNLHLHIDGAHTNYARTIKEISIKIDLLRTLLLNSKSSYDLSRLHKEIDDIHGFGPTISAKFIMYTIREMGIGSAPHSEFAAIAQYLIQEYHNSEWEKRLENAKLGLFNEVIKNLSHDPMAVDYFFDLDRYYCKKNKCDICQL